jgi:hypothetical protein
VVGERVHGDDPTAGLVRDQLRPGGRIGPVGVLGRHQQSEVDRIVVGVHHERVAPVVDAVLDVVAPREHDAGLGGRVAGGDQSGIGGGATRRADHDPRLGPCRSDPDEEPFVLLVEHADVIGAFGADAVAPHGGRPFLLVGGDVEQPCAVTGPGDAGVRGVVEAVVQIDTGRQVANA